MMRQKLFLFAALISVSTSLFSARTDFRLGQEANKHIVMNNCILCRVNGKVISACDVMKKMDLMFYKQYPEYASIEEAKHQYYLVNWKHVLEDLIDKELILADAEEHKIPISNGDVRQEMETIFGPNIIQNLDKINLSFDDAWKLVLGEITIRRMLFIRVNQKVLKQVTPQDVRVAYEEFAKENIRLNEWTYFVISIRDPDPSSGAEAANTVYRLLDEKVTLSDLPKKLKDENLIGAKTVVNVSQEHKHTEKDISEAYKEILVSLNPGEHSTPSAHQSKSDKSQVYRIFYLEKMQHGGPIPFSEVSEKIKEKLLDTAIDKETIKYLGKLRKHYDVQDNHLKEMLEQGYQPFALK